MSMEEVQLVEGKEYWKVQAGEGNLYKKSESAQKEEYWIPIERGIYMYGKKTGCIHHT